MKQLIPVFEKQKQAKKANPKLSKFKQLQRDLKKLNSKAIETQETLDKSVQFFHSQIFPLEPVLLQALEENILSYIFILQKNQWSAKDRNLIMFLISDKLENLHARFPSHVISDPLQNAIEEFFGINIKEIQKQRILDQLKDLDLDLDTDLSDADNAEELLEQIRKSEKIQEKLKQKAQSREAEFEHTFRSAFEHTFQSASNTLPTEITALYRKLAKNLHPDFEQDPKRKLEKEQLMIHLNKAYQEQNLTEILQLLSQLKLTNELTEIENNEKILDKLIDQLKAEKKELRTKIQNFHLEPKYAILQRFLFEDRTWPVEVELILENLKEEIEILKMSSEELQSKNGHKIMKKRIQKQKELVSMDLQYLF